MNPLQPINIDTENFLKSHCSLPPLPRIVMDIQNYIQSENLSVSKVAELIGKDPALTAQILKVVNSAYYSLPREVSDVRLAVGFLGIHEVYRIALSISVLNMVKSGDKAAFDKVWKHTLYTSLIAKYLANVYEPLLSQGELWAAAILYDIGKLVYIKYFPDHYKAIDKHAEQNRCLISQAEEALGLPASAWLGKLLCEHWQLPNLFREVCEKHDIQYINHFSPGNAVNAYRKIIGCSDLMAYLSMYDLHTDCKESIHQTVCNALGCSQDEFLVHMGKVYELKDEKNAFII